MALCFCIKSFQIFRIIKIASGIIVFFTALVANFEFADKNKNTRVGPFPWKRAILQNPDRERTNQSAGICLRLGLPCNNNLLLTEREGRTGEYWPEVVTVRTKTTEGQYSPVRLEQARLVSSLLCGTLFLIVKCTSGGLHLKNDRLLHPSLKFRKNCNPFSFCW